MYKLPESIIGFYHLGYIADNKFYIVIFKPFAVGPTYLGGRLYNTPYNIKKTIYDYCKILKNKDGALKLFGFHYNIY